ncbi:MAG: VCBS repeat-containing protein [Chloracidobacterium sp.]|nr:VCBS repeat-containing protein [Chloracidobacterium sp.]
MTKTQKSLIRTLIIATTAALALVFSLFVTPGTFGLETSVSAQENLAATRDRQSIDNSDIAPQACSLSGTLGTAPSGGSTGNLTTRLFRAGPSAAATCSGAVYPGTNDSGAFLYNVHNITNTFSTPACVTFTLVNASTENLAVAAFRQPFVAGDISSSGRYLGDPGVSTGVTTSTRVITFQTIIPANTSIAVVVFSTVASVGNGTPYTLSVSSTNWNSTCGTGSGLINYTGPAVPIPDNVPAGVDISLPVAGIGRIRDLQFTFPFQAGCDATAGNTNAAVDHTFIGDLTFKLTSPKGTTVTFMSRRGGSRDNICSFDLKDQFNNPLVSTITSQNGQVLSGIFQPEPDGRFTKFRGENADGIWKLNVSDNSVLDSGNLRRFGLYFTGFVFPSNDLDNDGISDISVSRSNGGVREWWLRRSQNTGVSAFSFGLPSDKIVPGDYTGDGNLDLAVWRPSNGNWLILRSEDFSFYAFPFGANGDKPVPADYDSDGKMDAAVFRPAGATWYISQSAGGTVIQSFGLSSDAPVPADYDGDNKADLAIFRTNGANKEWWYQRSSDNTVTAATFGVAGDKAVPGDYTGDGKVDFAVWRPSNGNWFVLRSEDFSFYAFPFGSTNDIPVPGDYDGDLITDAAVFRPSGATWYLNRSQTGVQIQQFGLSSDTPLASAYIP